jgi:hypothetical protein
MSEEIRQMLSIRHQEDELKMALAQVVSPTQEVIIKNKIEELVRRGMKVERIGHMIVQWMAINNITTESPEFNQNATRAIHYLDERAEAQKEVTQ